MLLSLPCKVNGKPAEITWDLQPAPGAVIPVTVTIDYPSPLLHTALCCEISGWRLREFAERMRQIWTSAEGRAGMEANSIEFLMELRRFDLGDDQALVRCWLEVVTDEPEDDPFVVPHAGFDIGGMVTTRAAVDAWAEAIDAYMAASGVQVVPEWPQPRRGCAWLLPYLPGPAWLRA